MTITAIENTLRRLRLVVFSLSMLLLSAGIKAQVPEFNLGFKLLDGQEKTVIPFEIHNNLIVVPVVLDGRIPLKFILDTGVRTSILTERSISDLLNLQYSRKKTIYGLGGEKIVDAYIANNVTIELPGIRGAGHALFVLEEDFLQLRNFLGVNVHGILGYELFSRFVIEIHYSKRQLIIRDPQTFKPKRGYRKVPIQVEDTKPYVVANVDINEGIPLSLKLMIDTGASHSLMLIENSMDAIQVPQPSVDSNLGRGLGGTIEGQIARIGAFELGNFSLTKPIATFPYPDTFFDIDKANYRNGTIGGGIVSRFNIIFDFSREFIYIKKNSEFRKPFNYNLSGLVIKATGNRLQNFEVVEVRENSAGAEAGVQVGDQIIEINNHTADEMTLDGVIGFFNSRVNRKVNLILTRDGRQIFTTFRLKSVI